MRHLDKPSAALGIFFVLFLWAGSSLITAEDTHTASYIRDVVVTAGSAVMAVWLARGIARGKDTDVSAHVDAEGPVAVVRCTDCGAHVLFLEHGQDLDALLAIRDRHQCDPAALQGGGADV